MTAYTKRPYQLLAGCALLTVLIFVVDLQVPRGVADTIPYVAVVLLALRFREARYPVAFAAVCSVLVGLGYVWSPPGGALWVSLVNRGMVLFALWVTVMLSLQKRKMEQAYRQVEARARAILEATADAVLTVDAQGHLTSLNPAAERIFARTDGVGQPLEELIAPVHRARVKHLLRPDRAGAPRARVVVEVLGQRPGGDTFPLEVSVSRMADGTAELSTLVARDVTDRRRLEQQILSLSDRERTRIGHDLQEGLGQMLTGIGLINRSLATRLRNREQPFAEEVAQVTELIQEADAYARGLARGLVPVDLDAAGLAFALRRLAGDTARLWSVSCSAEEEGEVLVHDNAVATHLFRIAQEAVHEAVVLRKATHVTIRLTAGPHLAQLEVVDDGRAAAADAAPNEVELGRSLMTYRAHLIGATFDARTGDGGATVLACTLPHPGRNGKA